MICGRSPSTSTPTRPSRRTLIKTTLCGAAGIGLANVLRAAQTATQPAGGADLKISLNAYSFNKPLTDAIANPATGTNLPALLDFCAKHRFDGLDATGYYFPGYPKRPSEQYVDQLKRKAADLGVGISGTGVRNTFTTSDKAARAADVQLVKDWVEVAARLGAPVLRVFADTQIKGQTWETVSKGFTRDQVQEWIAEAIRECAEHGGKFGVKIGVQNHLDFIRTGQQHLSLIKTVNSPWCGPIVDIGSYASTDPYANIAMVAPHAVNWQIKTSIFGPDGPIATDLSRLMRIVRSSGYHGYLPIEVLAPSQGNFDPYASVPEFLAKVREAMAAA